MKRLLLSLLIACCMSVSPLFAATISQRAGMADLIKKLQNNAVSANDVWGEIKKLNIRPNDYNDPEYQRMNRLAIDLLNKSGFTINNKRILLETNLGSLPTSSKPMKVMARGEVSAEKEITAEQKGKEQQPGKPYYEKPEKSSAKPVEPLGEEKEEEIKILEVPGTGTVQDALTTMKNLTEKAQAAKNLTDINALYKDFYQYQNMYAGLSGVEAKQGYLFWKKTISQSEKAKFALASAVALRALMDKEFELRGESIKLTNEESLAFVAEVNKTNPFAAYIAKTITKDQYEDIIKAQNGLLKWKKIQQSGRPLTRDDLDAMKEAVQKAGSSYQYVGEFTKKIGQELTDYLSSPQVITQTKLLTQETAKLDDIRLELDSLNEEILKAINTVSEDKFKDITALDFAAESKRKLVFEKLTKSKKFTLNGTITPIDFASKFTKINTMIAKLAGSDKTIAQAWADQTFLLFGIYVGFAQSAQSNLWTQYRKQPNVNPQALANKLNDADAKSKALNKDYRAFPSYIFPSTDDTTAKLLLTLSRITDKEKRLPIVKSVLLELHDKILAMEKDLARGARVPVLDNFERYADFFDAVLAGGFKLLDQDDKDQVRELWNMLQAQYAQYLRNVIIQYREDNDLSHLHELATGETVKIVEGVKNMLPEAPFNAISQMLTDLDEYFNSDDGKAIKTEITKEIIENLCYICAAFDGFSYALLTGTLQKDNITKAQRIKNAVTWLYSGFWGILGYKVEATKDAFQKQNEKLVNEFLTEIANTLKLYNSSILSKLKDSQDAKAYNSDPSALNIMEALGTEKLEKANLYSKGELLGGAYRYGLIVPSRITLAGGTEVTTVSIENITAIHKKDYARIANLYMSILEKAYGDPKWEEKAKVRELSAEIAKLMQQYNQRMSSLKARYAQLEQQIQDNQKTTTAKQILDLKQQIKVTEEEFKKIVVDGIQKQYEKALEDTGIYNQ